MAAAAAAGGASLPAGGSDATGSPMAGVGNDANTRLTTLDEPVLTTIGRDLKQIGEKLKHVLVPAGGNPDDTIRHLRDWDLWGPLLLCLVLAIVLSWSAPAEQASLTFSSVFVIVWAGAAAVTVNCRLLGAALSFFQSVCVLGYCIAPLVVAAIIGRLWSNGVFRALLVLAALAWSCRASLVFLGSMVEPDRQVLALFPALLFYVIIGWIVFLE